MDLSIREYCMSKIRVLFGIMPTQDLNLNFRFKSGILEDSRSRYQCAQSTGDRIFPVNYTMDRHYK